MPLRVLLNQALDCDNSISPVCKSQNGRLTGDEVFAVGTRIPAHARELRPDLTDQELPLLSFSDGEGSLQNIIWKSHRQIPGSVASTTRVNSLAN